MSTDVAARGGGARPAIEERPLDEPSIPALYAMLAEPSLAFQSEWLLRPRGIEDMLADPHTDLDSVRVAYADGELAGFRFLLVLPGLSGPWAMARIGVGERFRRRGIGTRLLEALLAHLRARPDPVAEISTGVYLPDEPAFAFLRARGFAEVRTFWLMERPPRALPAPAWPEGVEVRVMDGGEPALADWNDCYNESFAGHFHFVPTSLSDARAFLAQSSYTPGSVVLAYRGGRCVGFVRSILMPERGEVGVLGVVPAARGIGLGRALLRESVRWLEEQRAPRVTLMVDGENESALALYRQEGFEVARTRRIWSRPLRLPDPGVA